MEYPLLNVQPYLTENQAWGSVTVTSMYVCSHTSQIVSHSLIL